jgi:hypothetical protein
MQMTKEQIKVVEKLADELMKCVNNQSYRAPSATIIQLTPSRRYREEMLILLENTNIGAKIERDFNALDKLHEEYESWRFKTITEDNKEEFELLVDSIKGALYDLSDTLNWIAQQVRENTCEKDVENAPFAKSGKISRFFWKLYEKTLKVIVDVITERLWPK